MSAENEPSTFGALTSSAEGKPSVLGALTSSAEGKSPVLGALTSSADSKPSVIGALTSSADSKPSPLSALNTPEQSDLSALSRFTDIKPSPFAALNTAKESKPSALVGLTMSEVNEQSPLVVLNTSDVSDPSYFAGWRKSAESKPSAFGALTSMGSKTTQVNMKPRCSIKVKASSKMSTKSKSLGSSSMMTPLSSFGTSSTTANISPLSSSGKSTSCTRNQPFGSLGSSTTYVFPDIVSITTGEGGLFSVPLALLTKEKGSTLAAMFEGHSPLRQLPDGTFYIDVDKESFQDIMDFLRYNLHPQICCSGDKGYSERRILRLFKAAEKLGLYKLMSIIKQFEPVQRYLKLNDKDIVDAVSLVLSRLDRRELKRSGHLSIRLDCVWRCFDDLENSCAHDCDINIFEARIYLKDVESHTLEMICCSLKEKGFDVEGVEIYCDFICKEHSQIPQDKPCCTRISYIVNFLCNDLVFVKRQPLSLFSLMNKKDRNRSSTEKQTELHCTTTSTQTEGNHPDSSLDRTKTQAVDVYEYCPGNDDSGVFLKNGEEPWA